MTDEARGEGCGALGREAQAGRRAMSQGADAFGGAPHDGSTLHTLLLVVGVALFAPVSTYRFSGELFVFGHEPVYMAGDPFDFVQSGLLIALGICLAMCGRFDNFVRVRLRMMLAATCALLTLLLVMAGLFNAPLALEVGIAILSPVYRILLSYAWASTAARFSARWVGMSLVAAILLSILLIAAVQAPAVGAGISRAGRTVALTLVSGFVWCMLPAGMRGVGGATTGASPICGLTQSTTRMAYLRKIVREPLAMVFVFLLVYLATTSVIRAVYAFGSPNDEYLYKAPLSKVIVGAIATLMLAIVVVREWYIRRQVAGADVCSERPFCNDAMRRGAGIFFPWMVFIALCFGVLYFAIIFFNLAPFICQAVIFPSRMYAFYLAWLAGVALAFRLHVRPGALACAFWGAAVGVTRIMAQLTDVAMGWLTTAISGMRPDDLLLPATVAAAALTTIAAGAYLVVMTRARLRDVAQATSPAPPDASVLRRRACEQIASACDLTSREVQVLELLSMGNSYKKISEDLGLSMNTVTSYVKDLYRKTGLHEKQEVINRVGDIMRDAMRSGLQPR